MSGARLRATLFIIAVLIVAAAAIAALSSRRSVVPPAERPTLLILTSLPLVFGEQFTLEGGGSAALDALETRYRVTPISVSSTAELGKGRLLLMAHPRAQTAEDLVALDSWVRGGGRVLLLADPMLEWPSGRPLGDPLRPPAMFMDTGLLGHWGLRLDAPDERGPALRRVAGHEVMTESPGSLRGKCRMSRDRLVARCDIGKGSATVVADADWLGVEHLDGPTSRNLDALLAELRQFDAD